MTEKKEETAFVIRPFITKRPEISHSTQPPPPGPLPITFYGDLNFILVKTSRIFYHTKHVYHSCVGEYNYDPKPPQINLSPNDLREIDIKNLPEFLNTINDSILNNYFFASISSSDDTVRNPGFKIIRDFFKSHNLNRYIIRKWTEEEQYVTVAKITNKQYDRNAIRWTVGFEEEFVPSTSTETLK
jgi:hypothetical protein